MSSRTRSPSTIGARLVAASVFVGLAGCSLFVSLDGLTDGAGGNGPFDAALDASNETSAPGDGGASETGTDAAFMCPGFCDTFDDRTTILGSWDSLNANGTGVDPSGATISTTIFSSAPHAAQFHMPARTGGTDYLSLDLSKNFPLVGNSVTIDVDIKVVGADQVHDGFANLVEIALDGYYAGSVTLSGGADIATDYWVNYPDGGHSQTLQAIDPIDDGWHHFHYAVVYDRTNGSLHSTWDGAPVLSADHVETYAGALAPKNFTVSIGWTSHPSMPALDIYYDNLQVQ